MPSRRRTSGGSRSARFGVYLDLETRNALRKAAIDAGVSATDLVERLIQSYLARRARAARGRG